MSQRQYPLERIRTVLLEMALSSGWRIFPSRHLDTPLGTVRADSRFCSRAAGYSVLYAASEFATAVVETVIRDRFTGRLSREIPIREITASAWVRLESVPGLMLTLLDLREDGCVKIGAPTDVVNARNHAAGRAFATAIHAQHPDVDGLVYRSRLTASDAYAVFDRAVPKLRAQETGQLAYHPGLPAVLEDHDIRLVT